MAAKKKSSKTKKPAGVGTKKRTSAKGHKSAAAGSKASPGTKAKSAGKNRPLVAKQPQSKQKAAVQHHMFLHEDDAWSLAYYNSNDLHSVERQLFG